MMTSMAGMVATDCRPAQEMTISSALKTSTTETPSSQPVMSHDRPLKVLYVTAEQLAYARKVWRRFGYTGE